MEGANPSPTVAGPAQFSRFEHAAVGTIYIIIALVGASVNLTTAWIFYKDTKLLRGSQPWLHILLALCNVCVVGFSPFPASSSFSGRWLYGNTMCQIYAFEGMFGGIAAIGSVVALCIERYIVARRKQTDNPQTSFYCWSVMLVLGNALFWATMPLLGWSRYAVEHIATNCAIDWMNPDDGYASYIMTLFLFSFVVPVSIAFFCLSSTTPATTPVTERAGTGGGSDDSAKGTSDDTTPADAFHEGHMKTLCYVFFLFVLVGWGPFAYLCVTAIFVDVTRTSMLATIIPPLAAKAMVSAYPLAYAIMSPRFKNNFVALISADVKQD